MLKSLFIKNYALIDELNIDFHPGFSVITGETGAGKSIILGAIGLLLGQRADSKSIKTGETKCTIEAVFDLSAYKMDRFFKRNDLDFDGAECIVRRELQANGKSRAFINDTPTQLPVLKELGEHLIDIHSQHQNLLLSKENFQINVLDIMASNQQMLEQYQALFYDYRQKSRELEQFIEAARKDSADKDYLEFQLQQLDELELKEGEQEQLESESEILSHAEEIKKALFTSEAMLTDDDGGILNSARSCANTLSDLSRIFPGAEQLAERVQSCYIELKDIADELSNEGNKVEYNPERLDQVNSRLDALYSAQKKHHAASVEELIAIADGFRTRLNAITGSDEGIRALEEKLNAIKAKMLGVADELSKRRASAAKIVETEMKKLLIPLGIPNVQFAIEIASRNQPDEFGKDKVNFMFSANKNSALKDVSEVASGGEIARVMLSLKALIAGAVKLPTIIFDEIDTGVSGSIAESMANIMSQLASHDRQVISITHLPQIAAIGANHYKVYKEDVGETTISHIVHLSQQQRIEEIANMLSGAKITEAAISNAKELLRIKE